jgi:hypothetical protein
MYCGLPGEAFSSRKRPVAMRTTRRSLHTIEERINDQSLPVSLTLFVSFGFVSVSGTITDAFLATQTKIYQVDLSLNRFEGWIPTHLLPMPFLQFLDLHDNRLAGVIPELLVFNDILLFLSIPDNRITGQLPVTIVNMRALLHLDGR